MRKAQKVTAIPWFHNNGNKEKLNEHSSAVEANTSYEAGTSSEVKISPLFQRWNVTIITRGIVVKYSIFLFVLFPDVFSLLLEVRAFEADQLAGLNFSDRDKTEKFQLLPSLLAPSPSSSVCSVVPSVQVLRVELLVWPTGSWHVRVQDTKNLDL